MTWETPWHSLQEPLPNAQDLQIRVRVPQSDSQPLVLQGLAAVWRLVTLCNLLLDVEILRAQILVFEDS